MGREGRRGDGPGAHGAGDVFKVRAGEVEAFGGWRQDCGVGGDVDDADAGGGRVEGGGGGEKREEGGGEEERGEVVGLPVGFEAVGGEGEGDGHYLDWGRGVRWVW